MILQTSSNESCLSNVGKKLFGFSCFILAGYTVLTQVLKFLDNEDSSSVNYKPFNENTNENYPTYSFCFLSTPWSTILNNYDEELLAKYAVNSRQLNELMKGNVIEKEHWKTSLGFANFSHIDYSQFTFKFERFLKTFSDAAIVFEAKDCNQTRKYENTPRKNEIWPFYQSYEDPDTICFTRKNEEKTNLIRTNDMIWMDMKYFKHAKVFLHVYLHHVGHLTRSLGKPHFRTFGTEIHDTNSKINLKINHVSILRRRENSKSPCDMNLKNDDDMFRNMVIKQVGCAPSYWKSLLSVPNSTKICATSDEMFAIYHYLTNKDQIMSLYDQPCNYMKISVETVQQPNFLRYMLFHLVYTSEHYEEYLNSREFGYESLGAGVGGYVGIFLGYSFLQIPSTLNAFWMWLKRVKATCHKNRK